MSTTFTAAFNSLYNALPSARARARSGRRIVDRCMTSGVRDAREDTEYGQGSTVAADLRLLIEDELPQALMSKGKKIDVEHTGSDGWRTYRIGERVESAGVLVLSLENPHE